MSEVPLYPEMDRPASGTDRLTSGDTTPESAPQSEGGPAIDRPAWGNDFVTSVEAAGVPRS